MNNEYFAMQKNQGFRLASGRKYAKVFALGLQEQMEYRFNTLLESFVGLGSFVVTLFLWSSIFAANGGKAIGGMSFPQMLTYVLLSKFWDWVQNPGGELDTMIPEDIRNGGLSKVLARPLSDRYYRLCLYLSHRILYGFLRMLPVVALMCLMPGLFALPVGPEYALLPLVMLLSLLLQFTFSYTVALMAFWFLAIDGLLFLKRIIVSFLAGAWIPLMLLPSSAQKVSEILPFQYMVFFPVQLAMTRMPAGAIVRGGLTMCSWIVILWALSVLLWKRGLRHYSAAGI
jgi:ABC-2 type transport system permease protein